MKNVAGDTIDLCIIFFTVQLMTQFIFKVSLDFIWLNCLFKINQVSFT